MDINCERGKVKHPATHLEIARVSDDFGRFVVRTHVCEPHTWTKVQYEADGSVECKMVTRRKL